MLSVVTISKARGCRATDWVSCLITKSQTKLCTCENIPVYKQKVGAKYDHRVDVSDGFTDILYILRV